MRFEFRKNFHFSASFSRQGRVFGHNYVLGICTEGLDETSREALEKKIQGLLIDKIHSRDLGMGVDFLKEVEPTEENLLKIFWSMIEENAKPAVLRSLSLERDSRTKWTLCRE